MSIEQPSNLPNETDAAADRQRLLAEKAAAIDRMLASAQEQALEEDEMEMLLRRKNFLALEEKSPETDRQLQKVNELISRHMIIVQTLPEYKMLLDKTGVLEEEQAVDILAHENAHANKAEALGADFGGYALLVWHGEKGFGYLPFALTKVEQSTNAPENIAKEISIANAPEEYGNATSASDRARIEELEMQLKALYPER